MRRIDDYLEILANKEDEDKENRLANRSEAEMFKIQHHV